MLKRLTRASNKDIKDIQDNQDTPKVSSCLLRYFVGERLGKREADLGICVILMYSDHHLDDPLDSS